MPSFCTKCHRRVDKCKCRGKTRVRSYGKTAVPMIAMSPAQLKKRAYAQALAAGAQLMKAKANFGGLTDSDEKTKDCKFNRALWDRVLDKEAADEDDKPFMLVLKEGKSPAAALKDLFAHVEAWAFDCAEAIQLLRWWGQLAALGDDAFDARVTELAEGFRLREHDSTGLGTKIMYVRRDEEGYYTKDGLFRRDDTDEEVLTSGATLLSQAPPGSRVMWKNHDEIVEDEPFENENSIKLGDDAYFAHPMGLVNERELVLDLARHAFEEDDISDDQAGAYAKKHISLAEIEHYEDV